ncbi:MAG: 4'-phosphopantetheinyl transferase superfamily protein [Flavisolibacter sp.]|nr:4'-phosphopantetheinyl transferase superfamily protein [Flavisolibacter sp.]
MDQLSPDMQNQILRYRKWEDRQRSLLGKALLITGLQSLGLHSYSLRDLKRTEFHKPYFDNTIDFNIAHSGEYVMCGISESNRIGIDVEEIKDIPILDFVNEFSKEELEDMQKAENPLHSFYTYWTKKEAFLKAIGSGLNTPLNKVAIKDNIITWENKKWYLFEIKLNSNHVSHVAADCHSVKINIEMVDF